MRKFCARAFTLASCVLLTLLMTIPTQHAFASDNPDLTSVSQQLVRSVQHVARVAATPVRPSSYSVRHGDTLSRIAKQFYGSERYWPALGHANKLHNPDLLLVGQRVGLPRRLSPNEAPYHVHYARPAHTVTYSAPARHSTTPAAPSQHYTGSTAMQQCIISRESGGNPDIWNATGHWGLYQFSYSTWVASGGAPSLFGHASAAYQTEVFWNAVRERGYSDWAPYDGC